MKCKFRPLFIQALNKLTAVFIAEASSWSFQFIKIKNIGSLMRLWVYFWKRYRIRSFFCRTDEAKWQKGNDGFLNVWENFQYPSSFNILALRCFLRTISCFLNRSNTVGSFFIAYMAIFRLYLSIWFVSITLNRLWWAVFRWRLYPIRSRLARDLPTWLDLTATTGWTVCFFWIKHPNDNEKSKKYKFISFFLNLRWCFLLSFFINWALEVPFIPIRWVIARNYISLTIIGWLLPRNFDEYVLGHGQGS